MRRDGLRILRIVLTKNVEAMKKVLLFLLTLSLMHEVHAQNDSIAMSQMKELGVYYLQNDTLVQITPIMRENSKTAANPFSVKTSVVFEGEYSEHVLANTPIFYIFIPREFKSRINVKQFRMVTLTSKNGKRQLDTGSVSMFGARTGAKSKTMEIMNLNEECFKIYAEDIMPAGHYGIFYNYSGGMPLKLYDFDITE